MKISNSYIKLGMLAMLVFAFANTTYAQQGMGTNNPDKSSALDITSTTKGLLMPRMTTIQRTAITSPATGLEVYDTTTNSHWFYNGTAWVNNVGTDLRLIGNKNHLTQDAGVGGNGSSLGTGTDNIAIGHNALSNNTSGSGNLSVGTYSLLGNTVGERNTAVGGGLVLGVIQGNDNTALGAEAGNTIKSGDNNIFIGSKVQFNISETSSNQLNIGNWIYGNNGRIGIGASNPTASAALEISSTNKGLLMPRMTTAERTAITSPATGLEVYDTTTNTHWFYNGTAWVNNNGQVNDLRLISGGNHITQDAGVGGNGTSVGTGIQNIGIGFNTLSNNTTGIANIAIGSLSLSYNTAGVSNVAVGLGTLSKNTTGVSNTAMGINSLKNNVTGERNVAIGGLTLELSTGDRNIAFGTGAGGLLTSGNDNIFIGNNVEPNVSTTGSNQLNIGGWIYGDDGKIGIGVPIPTEKLHVSGTIKATAINFTGLPTYANDAAAGTLTAGDMYKTATGELRIKL